MENIILDIRHALGFIKNEEIENLYPTGMEQMKVLHNRSGKGSGFLGWLDLPARVSETEISEILLHASEWREKFDTVVMVGIGGSYLGARFVLEALSHSFGSLMPRGKSPLILYAGHNLSEDYLSDLMEVLRNRSFGVVVISKSGTTTEPAVAFRILKNELIRRYGRKSLADRVIAITDSQRGALRQMAEEERFTTFSIPDDVGGRYSVLTPVGLVPIAIGGFDIRKLLEGGRHMMDLSSQAVPPENNPALKYALTRNLLFRKDKLIEILVNYEPRLHYFTEWWKQLFGESEGKEFTGIFPAGVDFTTDLHSMGQYIQEGKRHLFETVLTVKRPNKKLEIPEDEKNLDTLNFLAGKRIDQVNKMAELGTTLAHVDGEVPNIRLEIPELKEEYLGQLIYFFEKSCALSGYLLGINPFDQPGVESYKNNMFALLGKPGSEDSGNRLRERLIGN